MRDQVCKSVRQKVAALAPEIATLPSSRYPDTTTPAERLRAQAERKAAKKAGNKMGIQVF